MGVNKMKATLRAYCYWPNMSKDIADFCRTCVPCTTFQLRSDAAPLVPVAEIETRPWNKISLDLTGPANVLDGHVLLTMIDLYSRYPEATILKRGNTQEIIDVLTCHFARYGLPNIIITDNGTPFISSIFEDFLRSHGITHVTSSLYYPRANSTVERLHSTIKSRLKKIRTSSQPLPQALLTVLTDIRSTPNDVTGVTPFQRFFGRPMQTKLSKLAISDDNTGPSCKPRNVIAEYSNKWSCNDRNYQIGDFVLIRKGDGKPFNVPGQISGRVGRYTYEVMIGTRKCRYNQRNLKPSFQAPTPSDDDALKAYVSTGEAQEPSLADNQPQDTRESYSTQIIAKTNILTLTRLAVLT